MPATRPRRIVRRAVWTLVGMVLLGCLYVNLFWIACWADSRSIPCWSGPGWNGLPFFDPLVQYSQSDLPAARDFEAVTVWILNGRIATLAAEYEFCAQIRKARARSAR